MLVSRLYYILFYDSCADNSKFCYYFGMSKPLFDKLFTYIEAYHGNLRADEKVWYVETILRISRKCSKI